jgi:hypothetical protein
MSERDTGVTVAWPQDIAVVVVMVVAVTVTVTVTAKISSSPPKFSGN